MGLCVKGKKEKELTRSLDRPHGRKRVHDDREGGPEQENPVGEQAQWTHPEWAMSDVVTAFNQKTDYRNGIRDVKKHNAGRDHAKGVVSVIFHPNLNQILPTHARLNEKME